MPISEEMIEAARTLGASLGAAPAVQAFRQVEAAISQDVELMTGLSELDQRYNGLIERQRNGQILTQEEIQAFYSLRDHIYSHPLMVEREERRKVLKALFEQAGAVISSILTVEYSTLALPE